MNENGGRAAPVPVRCRRPRPRNWTGSATGSRREWRSGGPPDLAAYLARAEGAERAALARELIAIDVHWRRRVGEHPVLAEYLARFPYGEATIKSVFGLGGVQETAVGREVTPTSVPASPRSRPATVRRESVSRRPVQTPLPCSCCPATRSWENSVEAAWESSTRPDSPA